MMAASTHRDGASPLGSRGRRLAYRACCWALVVAPLLGNRAMGASDAAPLGRLDYAPYCVAVTVSFAADPTVTPTFRRHVVSLLTSRIVQVFGAAWSLLPANSVREDDRLAPANEVGLERLTFSTAGEFVQGIPCEKAYFLTVELCGQTWQIAGREWDQTLQTLGPVSREATFDHRGIADCAVKLLQRIFTPLLTVDDADRNSQLATLTIRAGSIPFGDPHFVPLKKGSLLRPVFRFLTAKRELRQIVPLDWTYLVIEGLQPGRAKCSIATSYRAPLAANMRRRVEVIAVLLRPEVPETRLRLVTGRNVPRPVGGILVSMRPVDLDDPASTKSAPDKQSADKHSQAKPSADKNVSAKEAPAPPMLMSDRRGVVAISTDPLHPLQMLIVHSGTALLARRPFVPGIDAEVTLELPDDGLRLNTEREIDLLRGQLIETVAQRAAFIGRTRAAFKKNDDLTVRKLFDHLQKLPNADAYANELNKIRVLALEENLPRKDRIAERRINDLCQRTQQLIMQYLPDDRLQTLKEELAVALEDKTAKTDVKSGGKSRRTSASAQSVGSDAAVPQTDSSRGAGADGSKAAVKRFRTSPPKPAAAQPAPVTLPKGETGL